MRPDIVLLDLLLRGEDGWDVVRKMRVGNSPAKIIIFPHFEERFIGPASKNFGCSGYVSKGQASEELIEALRTVLGGFFTPRSVSLETANRAS